MSLKKWQKETKMLYVRGPFAAFTCLECGTVSEDIHGLCECGEPLQQLLEAHKLRYRKRNYSDDCCGEYVFSSLKDAINHAWKCSRGMLKGGAWK